MRIHELGHVVLYVSDLVRSANFYRDLLGFREITRQPGMALYSSGRTHHEMLLLEVGGEPRQQERPEPGLYHIGFKIGDSTDDLRQARDELAAAGVPIVGVADHHVTHSLYVLDPDGNELELYADVNDDWKNDPLSVLSPTKELDL